MGIDRCLQVDERRLWVSIKASIREFGDGGTRKILITESRLREPHSLATFFERWRALSQAGSPVPLEARLGRLFAEHRSHLASQAAGISVTQPSAGRSFEVEGLTRMLHPIGAALQAKRLQGGILNVWTIAGLRRDEVRTARVLAAMFSPAESRDLGRAFLEAFMDRIVDGDRSRLPTGEELAAGYSVQTEACPLGAADDRVDLSIEGPGFILVIEVKIDAGEGREQLARYETVLQRKAEALGKRAALVYLSPTRPQALPAGAFYADWRSVVKAARAVVTRRPQVDRSVQHLLLKQFAEHVRQFS